MTGAKQSTKVMTDSFKLSFSAKSTNEAFARLAVSAFVARLDPTVEELADIKTAVSEAVTNCIVHAYKNSRGVGSITMKGSLFSDGTVKIEITDKGCGIPDIKQAMQPLYTTDAESERSGMGFTVMGAFCDKIKVRSKLNVGTTVVLTKRIGDE